MVARGVHFDFGRPWDRRYQQPRTRFFGRIIEDNNIPQIYNILTVYKSKKRHLLPGNIIIRTSKKQKLRTEKVRSPTLDIRSITDSYYKKYSKFIKLLIRSFLVFLYKF
jgi:hypothetical protein